ncbi:zinc finger BED domain-containing protein 5-like [Diabrotica undecimpunctata]|uniref:zinc finger BED domain-containing protein 5-like n=1 Tax=Diabrotica undecimpunctata TaxID=50387 RepID=UPI003B6320F4
MKRVCKNENEIATEASFIVDLHIAKAGKLHTMAEELIKPCVKDVVQCMLGPDMTKKIHNLDDSTDVAGLAVLLVFVGFEFGMKIEEELLMCEELKSYATGEEIFTAIHEYIRRNDMDRSKYVDICNDGATAMVEESFIQELKDVNWLLKLGYLSDIFEIINKTTTLLQGKGGVQLDKIKALRKKVTFFKACVEKRNVTNVSRLQEFVITNEINPRTNFFEIVIAHLQGLEESKLFS